MSSRQEEKEQRKAQRMAEEAKAKSAADRSRRLQMAGGAVLVLAIIVVAVVLITSGGGSDKGPSGKSDGPAVAIPAQKLTDLDAAAKAAGCQVRSLENFGGSHVGGQVTYKSNPPTSGNHNPAPADDGIYDPGREPATENTVHSLEHGRILVQYKPGAPGRRIAQLETLVSEKNKGASGYHTLLFQNSTRMPFAVAATGWKRLMGCPTFNDKVFDALRTFRSAYTDKGPELVP